MQVTKTRSSLTTSVVGFQEVRGQESVKRALEIAAAGGHNVLMVWTRTSHIYPKVRCFPYFKESYLIDKF